MKTKYLDIQNCTALLPPNLTISRIRELDDYLGELNSYPNHLGILDKLIIRNQKTQYHKLWDRFLHYDIDVYLTFDFSTGRVQHSLKDNIAFPEFARTGINKLIKIEISHIYPNGTRWTCKMPLQFLLKGWGDANAGYQGYVHTIKYSALNDETEPENISGHQTNEMHYVGITGRNWFKRFREHMGESFNGSHKLFHRAWQESYGESGMVYVSDLQMVNLSFEEAMEWEERYVDRWSLTPKGLNMIPGGFKGMKYLHEYRITDRAIVSLEERDRAIVEYIRQNPRKGIPNPFMSELWEDDEFYLRVIEARDNTLSPDQVLQIRSLANLGRSIPEITKEVEALNEAQVRNVVSGRTYKRIH